VKLFLSVFFLLSVSFVLAFGDTGSITVVSGKSFQINYDANYVQVLDAQPNKQDQGLIFSIQASNSVSTLELTLPRDLIDATKKDGSSDSFIVLVDGTFTSYVEKSSSQTSRTILIQLAPENKELEIIGTRLAGSENGSTGTPQTPVPPIQNSIPTNPTPQPANQSSQQNQTSNPIQKPTGVQSEKTGTNESLQNLPMQEILSKIFHFNLQNFSFNATGKQIIEYSVIASAILILIVVIASSKKSKTKKHISK
jgi:hypothetical protein